MSDDDDVVYMSGCSAAQQMWHFYHDCTDSKPPCLKCVCYVCDCQISKCTQWSSHINATASSKWLRKRRAERKKNEPALLPTVVGEAATSFTVANAITISDSDGEDETKFHLGNVQGSTPGSSFATLTSLVSAQEKVQERLFQIMLNTSLPPFKELELPVVRDPIAAASKSGTALTSNTAAASTPSLLKDPITVSPPEISANFMSISTNQQSTNQSTSSTAAASSNHREITQALVDAKLKRNELPALSSLYCKVCRRIKGCKHNSSELHQKSIAYDALRFLGIDCEDDDIIGVVKKLRTTMT